MLQLTTKIRSKLNKSLSTLTEYLGESEKKLILYCPIYIKAIDFKRKSDMYLHICPHINHSIKTTSRAFSALVSVITPTAAFAANISRITCDGIVNSNKNSDTRRKLHSQNLVYVVLARVQSYNELNGII